MSFITIYITNKNEEAAQKIAKVLIEERLVACANLFPIQSTYWWKGDIASEGEWVSLVKTIPEHWQSICEKVRAIHPYQVPCMMKTQVEANEDYEQWIRDCVSEVP